MTEWSAFPTGCFFGPKPHEVTSGIWQGALCSAAMDDGKQEVCIISSVSYSFFFFSISSYMLEKRQGEELDCFRYDYCSAGEHLFMMQSLI